MAHKRNDKRFKKIIAISMAFQDKLKWKKKWVRDEIKQKSFHSSLPTTVCSFFRMIYRCCLRNTIKKFFFTKNVTINFYLCSFLSHCVCKYVCVFAFISSFYRLKYYSNNFFCNFLFLWYFSTLKKKEQNMRENERTVKRQYEEELFLHFIFISFESGKFCGRVWVRALA